MKCLYRIRSYIEERQSKLIYNAFILSAFSYCPLMWMFCNKTSYKRINSVQKRALRAIYNKNDFSLDELLKLDNSDKIHLLNIRSLLQEIYKTFHDMNPSFMKDFFHVKQVPYNLRTSNVLVLPSSNTYKYGIYSTFFRGSLLWNLLPDNIKQASNLNVFKNKLKNWKDNLKCSCRICS